RVDAVMPVHGEVSTFAVNVPSAPRSYRWNKGLWVLDLHDFPRSANMLMYQLAHDDDVLGRLEAASLLAKRPVDARMVKALAMAATSDAHWTVRARAVSVLAHWAAQDSTILAPVLTASRDTDSRVRAAAATALGKFPGAAASARLRDL